MTRLMRATKGGDANAFDELVVKLRGRAFSVAHSLVGSREDALDMAQEAFLKTYRARQTFRENEPFLPWFHRILRNTCFSFLRSHRRLKPVSTSGANDEGESDWQIVDERALAPSAGVELEEEVGAFRAAFSQLSARDREILDLRHFQDLSYREIASAMGCPVGTVMSRLFHARRRLRDRLAPHLDPDFAETSAPPDLGGG